MARVAWEITLAEPIEHNGELIEKIGFRDMNGDDISSDKIKSDLLDNAANDNLSFKDAVLFSRSIASHLSCKPKLGSNGGKLSIPDYFKILQVWGEYFSKQMEMITEAQQEKEDASLEDANINFPPQEAS